MDGYASSDIELSLQLQERLIIAEERKAAALERIADQLPTLIEKMGSRGNWAGGKKDGRELGMFIAPPFQVEIDKLKVGDNLRVLASYYQVITDNYGTRIVYYSPFDKNGQFTDKVGTKVASIKTTGKKFSEVVPNYDKYTKDGKAHKMALKRAALTVGQMQGKDDKFLFLVSLKDHDQPDPMKVEFNGQIPQE